MSWNGATETRLYNRCKNWNAKHPIGTTVEYHPVIGDPAHRIRVTRSEAQVLSGHTAVVWLEGERGCVALDACVPTAKSANAVNAGAGETAPESVGSPKTEDKS